MPEFIELDEKVTLSAQLEEKGGPVILINTVSLAPEDVDQFLQTWTTDSYLMKQQPGFISNQLHRGIAGSCVFVNYAVWESTEHFKQAFNNPEFRAIMAKYPPNVKTAPHLFRKLAVPGICVAT